MSKKINNRKTKVTRANNKGNSGLSNQSFMINLIKRNIISIISLCISIVTLAVYIIGNHISKSNIDMQYALNLPNLNMNVSTDDNLLSCKITNNGGNIREAYLVPHMFFELRYCPNFEILDSQIIEINDFFRKKFSDELDLYWDSRMAYNIDDNGWMINIDQDELNESYTLLFTIQKKVNINFVTSELSLCFEIRYTDFTGVNHEEWYYADYTLGTLTLIDEDFNIPKEKYLNAKSIDIEDVKDNDAIITQLAEDYKEAFSKINLNQ